MIELRGRIWQLRRRVPKRYHAVESRRMILMSLHSDSRTVALSKAQRIWDELIEVWEARLAGDHEEAAARFAAAENLAQLRGFRYLSAAKVKTLPLSELLDRVEAISERDGLPEPAEAAALMGTVEAPTLTLSAALEAYWTLARDKTLGKSADQVRRWENPRKKAVGNLIAVVGDKPLGDLTREDMLAFRDWWTDRLATQGLTANSANKDLIHLSEVLRLVVERKRLDIDLPLGGLSFREGEKGTRPPFSADWITGRLLAPGALAGLNGEARGVLLAMVNTGARPSELANLTASTIRLDANVPHISIEPEGRQLKSANARRVLPLLGVSLEAMREHPDGFPRYRSAPASLSGTVNKFLRENGLLETPAHSLYSLRHAFEDRMLAAGVDERIRRDVLGHRLDRERYGAGASLAQLSEVLSPCAL